MSQSLVVLGERPGSSCRGVGEAVFSLYLFLILVAVENGC